MLDLARDIIGSQPILTAFLAIGLGYLIGQISIGGFFSELAQSSSSASHSAHSLQKPRSSDRSV